MRRTAMFLLGLMVALIAPLLSAPGAQAAPAVTITAPERISDDHCTGFCVSVKNATNRNLYMGGNPGSGLVPPGWWSDDYYPWLTDVDWVFVPAGCTITFRGRTYYGGEKIDVDGWSPWVVLYGNC